MKLQNLHTHTHYCDGKDAPETLVKRAIELGFSSLGFSGHIGMPGDPEYAMTASQTAAYKAELAALAEKYNDRIDIYTGIEFDLFSQDSTEGYDYVIGSMHCLEKDGVLIECDYDFPRMEHAINECFGGDAMAYAKEYFDNVMLLSEKYDYDFVGHFDLLTKFRENKNYFDASCEQYRRMAIEALHVVAERHNIFEINTGAMSRGYRKTPYPDPFLLREMKEIGAHVIVTSDCHDARFLDCHFRECYDMMREYGFKTTLYRTKNGWEEQPI